MLVTDQNRLETSGRIKNQSANQGINIIVLCVSFQLCMAFSDDSILSMYQGVIPNVSHTCIKDIRRLSRAGLNKIDHRVTGHPTIQAKSVQMPRMKCYLQKYQF